MVGMGLREFECTLCGNKFEQMSGDLMIPGPEICEECLREVWDMEDTALKQYVSTRLKEHKREEMIESMLQHIQWYKDTYTSVDEVLQSRINPFGF